MKKDLFSQNELMELEALEVRGGLSGIEFGQPDCINEKDSCGYGIPQARCTNNASYCGCPPPTIIVQNCPPT